KYRRAVGRGRLYEGQEPKQPEGKPRGASRSPRRRGEPPRPSYRRSLKLAAVFSAIMWGLVQVVPLGGKPPTAGGALFLAAIFLLWQAPFLYMIDTFKYRRWLKEQQGQQG
ncbi:MAG: hypothetical protein ACXVYV_03615, partial [Gaiellales bacterium]